MTTLRVPNLSLVVLIGPSGSGKSFFARKHFLPTEVVSSDVCRGLVSDDETNQTVTKEAFELVHFVAAKRLALGRLTVIDATNVQRESRKPLIKIARDHHCLPVAIVFNLAAKVCRSRNQQRADRDFGPHVTAHQKSQLKRSIRGLKREGFRHICIFESEEEVNAATLVREPLWSDKRSQRGPFDIIGDVHGCCDELEELLGALGYRETEPVHDEAGRPGKAYRHPEGRTAVFLGDLVDRGPRIVDTLKLVRNMVRAGTAFCVPGNHDMKLMRKLNGRNVQITHGLDRSLAEIESLPADEREVFEKGTIEFLNRLVSHYVFDDGNLVCSHAGMKEEMQGRGSARVRDFALYGETTGETDEFGLPVRYNWAAEYRGTALVVYGHTPIPEPEWLNQTVNIDTGCVFGGKLTSLRYPEKELVSIPARSTYCEPVRPLISPERERSGLSAQQTHDNVLDIEDVLGKRIVTTRLMANVTIREENAAPALEVMSRYATNPKWLVYLPPTMSPCESSTEQGLLEHPAEAFDYYRKNGVTKVVCEEKHMGSRSVVIVCKDEDVAARRFGITGQGIGCIYTRTGRRFFDDFEVETELLRRICTSMDASDFWREIDSDWVCLDCELMPWSAKAQALLKSQYAAVGAAARASLSQVVSCLEDSLDRHEIVEDVDPQPGTSSRPVNMKDVYERFKSRQDRAAKFVDAYRAYCWTVTSVRDLKIAPFHLLASEDRVYVDLDHEGHMKMLSTLIQTDSEVLVSTNYKVVNLHDPDDVAQGIQWWENLTEKGGEGMVVKPTEFIVWNKQRLVQPAVKVRGWEYLRIIYGPEYTAEEHLQRLRSRNLGRKRSLALREFALGIEALERFVRHEPLRQVHECVFGILALESEPVDPRL